jgi:holo-[acyl-carrier protein] synthase
MIYGIGVDLIEIARVKQAITRTQQRFIRRIYTEAEQQYCATQHPPYACYAARFVAKEAFLKALGTGLRRHMRWRDVEVHRDALGSPACTSPAISRSGVRRGVSGISTFRLPTVPLWPLPR